MASFSDEKPIGSSPLRGRPPVDPSSAAPAWANRSLSPAIQRSALNKVAARVGMQPSPVRNGTILHQTGNLDLNSAHSWSDEEKVAFTQHINKCLGFDPIARRHLPMDVNSMDLFEKTSDGLLYCRLINLVNPDIIDERALNTKENPNLYQKTENLNIAINSSKAIGCQVVNIGATDMLQGSPTLVLGLVWQIIKIQLMSQITITSVPELVMLLEEGELLSDFLKCAPESILLRWVNYHLKKASSTRQIGNFGSDLADCVVYSVIMHQIKPGVCPAVLEERPIDRAKAVIRNADAYGAELFISPADILSGNKKLNLALVAQLFSKDHGLRDVERKSLSVDLSMLDLDDRADSREERTLRLWINSLNIDGVYLNSLFTDIDDGYVILKLAEKASPGAVSWRRVNVNPTSRFKKVENDNYAVEICKNSLGFSMVNVGGIDILDCNKKLILSIISQMMRKCNLQRLQVLARTFGIEEVTEEAVVRWANERVAHIGREEKMRDFKDKTLSNGQFFLALITSIRPLAVRWDLVSAADDPESKIMNAKYALSCARKLGAPVFLTHEDIIEVKSKMLFNFVACIWTAELEQQALRR